MCRAVPPVLSSRVRPIRAAAGPQGLGDAFGRGGNNGYSKEEFELGTPKPGVHVSKAGGAAGSSGGGSAPTSTPPKKERTDHESIEVRIRALANLRPPAMPQKIWWNQPTFARWRRAAGH